MTRGRISSHGSRTRSQPPTRRISSRRLRHTSTGSWRRFVLLLASWKGAPPVLRISGDSSQNFTLLGREGEQKQVLVTFSLSSGGEACFVGHPPLFSICSQSPQVLLNPFYSQISGLLLPVRPHFNVQRCRQEISPPADVPLQWSRLAPRLVVLLL